MDAVLSLPIVLLHRDLSTANIIVDESCHVVGVIDWAEAQILPFGQDLHFLQNLLCALDLQQGWRPYDDFTILQTTFWRTFRDEVGADIITRKTISTIKTASIMGLLLYRGFTRRQAKMPRPTPICDDDAGRYNMLNLDAFIINPTTRIDIGQTDIRESVKRK
jgi:hypothetical protein